MKRISSVLFYAFIGAVGCVASVAFALSASALIIVFCRSEGIFSFANYICIAGGTGCALVLYRMVRKKLPLFPALLCAGAVWIFLLFFGVLFAPTGGFYLKAALISLAAVAVVAVGGFFVMK